MEGSFNTIGPSIFIYIQDPERGSFTMLPNHTAILICPTDYFLATCGLLLILFTDAGVISQYHLKKRITIWIILTTKTAICLLKM